MQRSRKRATSGSKPLKQTAYEALEHMIICGDIAGGSMLSETALAEQLGLGRTPVREALQRLAQEGLVVILPRRGLMVTEMNLAKQLQVLEVRRPLERLLASCAARRATSAQRTAMLEHAHETEDAAARGDGVKFLAMTRRNHALLEQASGNELIQNVMISIHARSRRFWYEHYERWGDLVRAGAAHANLLRSISVGDEEQSLINADRLVDYLEEFARSTIAPDASSCSRS